MKEYKLKIFKQTRLFISVVVVSVNLIFCLLLGLQFEFIFLKITVPVLVFGSIGALAYYFTVGHLTVKFQNGELDFLWKPKPIFNFKKYSSIKVDNITSIIVQNEMYVTQLKTKDVKIELTGPRSNVLESLRLLKLLRTETDVKTKDNWDILKERGWLKIFYIINLSVLVIVILVIITFIILKGFDPKLLFFPILLGTLFTSHLNMRNKLKK